MRWPKPLIIFVLSLLFVALQKDGYVSASARAADTTARLRTGKITPDNRPISSTQQDARSRRNHTWTTAHYIIPAWSLAVPGAAAYDHTPAFSFAGVSGELRIRLHDRFSAGAKLAWQRFSEEQHGTETIDLTTVTSLQDRRLDLVPILATVDCYMLKRRTLLPWAGFGVGAIWSSRKSEQFAPPTTLLKTETNAWQFSLAPRVGMLIMMRRLPLSVSAELHIAPPADGAPLLMMTSFHLGLGIPL